MADPDELAIFKSFANEFAASGAAGASSGKQEPNVYMGGAPSFGGEHEAQAPSVMSQSSAEQNFFSWSPAEQQAWANKMYRAGLINDPGNLDAAVQQWASAVAFAGAQYTYGGKKVTPWDVMQDRLGLSKQAGNSNGPRTTTSTSTTQQVLEQGDADAMIKGIFQNLLGRDPDKGELSRYRSMLINKVADNPTVTRTTQTVDAKGNSTSSSKTSGGVSSDTLTGMVSDPTKADPEWGAYQAATSYMGALEGLLGGGTPDLTGPNG